MYYLMYYLILLTDVLLNVLLYVFPYSRGLLCRGVEGHSSDPRFENLPRPRPTHSTIHELHPGRVLPKPDGL